MYKATITLHRTKTRVDLAFYDSRRLHKYTRVLMHGQAYTCKHMQTRTHANTPTHPHPHIHGI